MRDRHARLTVKPLTTITWVNGFFYYKHQVTQCKIKCTNGLPNVKMPFNENRIILTKKIREMPFHITQNMTSQWFYKSISAIL